MTPSRRPVARLLLAAGAAGLLVAAAPALGSTGPVPVPAEVKTCDGGRCEGTEAADTLVAQNAADQVIGRGGDDDIELDAVFPSGSADVGIGGEGRDCIDGGGAGDLMIGGPGDDNRPCEFTAFVDPLAAMTGGPGNDRIEGGPGNDSMNGIFDDDLLLGGTGDDLLRDGSPQDEDRLFGGPGKDTLDARDGDAGDLVDGGPGADDCSGDTGDRFVGCERIQRL